MTRPGGHLYVAFEGADGAGKTTVLGMVERALRTAGRPAVRLRQHAWLDAWATRVLLDVRHARRPRPPEEVVEAYRRDHELLLRSVVTPALAQGTVLQDRGRLSSVVHAAVLEGIAVPGLLAALTDVPGPCPDVVVLVDVAPAEAIARVAGRSKQRRAWERADRLPAVVRAHREAFQSFPWPEGTLRVRLDNRSRPDWRSHAERVVVGPVLERLAAAGHAVTPGAAAAG